MRSLISLLRLHSPLELFQKRTLCAATIRNFNQRERKEEEEDEVEIDQRKLPADFDPATFDLTEHCSPPTERVWRLVDEISALTLPEMVELSSILMKRSGIKDPLMVGVMKSSAAGVAAASAEAPAMFKEKKELGL